MSVVHKAVSISLASAFAVVAVFGQRPAGRVAPSFGTLDQRAVALAVVQQRAHAPSKPAASAQRAQQDFAGRITDFTTAWNSLLKASANGVWNPKQAKTVRQAFERVVQSEGWIEQTR